MVLKRASRSTKMWVLGLHVAVLATASSTRQSRGYQLGECTFVGRPRAESCAKMLQVECKSLQVNMRAQALLAGTLATAELDNMHPYSGGVGVLFGRSAVRTTKP